MSRRAPAIRNRPKKNDQSGKQQTDAGRVTVEELLISLAIPSDQMALAANELRSYPRHESMFPGGWLDDNIATIQRIGPLCSRLASELRQLDDFSKYYLSENLGEDELMRHLIGGLDDIAEKAKEFQLEKQAAHRPPGSINQPELQELVSILYRITQTYGGELTLSKRESTSEPIGGLPRAVLFVSRILPQKDLRIPSFKTLLRMRNVAREEYRSAELRKIHRPRSHR